MHASNTSMHEEAAFWFGFYAFKGLCISALDVIAVFWTSPPQEHLIYPKCRSTSCQLHEVSLALDSRSSLHSAVLCDVLLSRPRHRILVLMPSVGPRLKGATDRRLDGHHAQRLLGAK